MDGKDSENPQKPSVSADEQGLRRPLLYPAELWAQQAFPSASVTSRSKYVAPPRYVTVDGKRRRSPEYAAWADMVQRCTNPKNHAWKNYGGRGISVCDRWRGEGGFDRFAEDMGARPERWTLDRIDVDGDYEPDNCRWASETTQQRNRRDNRRLTIGGETMCLSAWAERHRMSRRTLAGRINSGWDPAVALATAEGVGKAEAHTAAEAEPVTKTGQRTRAASGFRGVHQSGAGWGAVIQADGRLRWLGTYPTPEEAARAYDDAALELHGPAARVNFKATG